MGSLSPSWGWTIKLRIVEEVDKLLLMLNPQFSDIARSLVDT